MKSSIYVSAEQIQVLGYAGNKVKQFATFPLPEGTIYNGTIMDAPFLTECLVSMKKDNPELFKSGVTVVMDGSSILSRRLVTPKLRNRQYLQLVRDDFIDSISNTNDLVCGYRKLESQENAILAYAVDKAQVDSYISTFKDAGIKPDAIHIGVEILLSYVSSMKEFKHSTTVLNVIDGLTMLSMLFVEGNNIYMSRTRLYGDENDRIHNSILANLNGLIQFAQSQNHDVITKSYYLGITDADVVLLQENNPYPDIDIGGLHTYQGSLDIPPATHFAYLNMKFGEAGVDLIAARKELDKHIKRQRPKKVWIPLLIIYVLAFGAVTGFLLHQLFHVGNDIQELRDHINSPDIAARLEVIEVLQSETAAFQDVSRQASEKAEWLDSMPEALSQMFQFVIFDHGVEVYVLVVDFNERSGIVRVSAITEDARIASDYVDALYDSGVAQHVRYQGFGSGAAGLFTFTVDITLNLDEGGYYAN